MWRSNRKPNRLLIPTFGGVDLAAGGKIYKVLLAQFRNRSLLALGTNSGEGYWVMIRKGTDQDFEEILDIINDAAIAYKGIIPPDGWHEPYMTREELKAQIEDGVRFSCYVDKNEIIGVMGIQDKTDVDLIRHAYVRTHQRQKGVGTRLLQELIKDSEKPILIGTWKAAHWAISFYEKQGFCLVNEEEKNRCGFR